MTEPAAPKLGQDDDDLVVSILGLGYAAEVDLLPGEIPLCAWDAALPGLWVASGTLYLTSRRLVWIRWRFGLPWIPKSMLISLDGVTGIRTRRKWSYAFFPRLLVVNITSGEQYFFLPMRYGAKAEEMAREITSILRQRGLLRD